jgi:hypothetical protein
MRIMLVYFLMEDGGSATDVYHYVRAAKELGHEIVVYGPPSPRSKIPFSMDVDSADAAVFVFEWTQGLRHGDRLDLARIVARIPRTRRVVIDCDGALNARMDLSGDYNHKDDASSARWIATCEALSDKLFQPTPRPRRPNVGAFFFHGYSETWERPLDLDRREYGMVYVGHSKFRWPPMKRVLEAIEPVKDRVGRICIVGHGWDALPEWAQRMGIESSYFTDKEMLARLGVETAPPVPFGEVIDWMSRALFNPVIYRPLFSNLAFVTCRTFETPAAGTIPLFGLDASYVGEVFGPRAEALALPHDKPEEHILDIVENQDRYADIALGVRRHMRKHHNYETRVKELVDIILA